MQFHLFSSNSFLQFCITYSTKRKLDQCTYLSKKLFPFLKRLMESHFLCMTFSFSNKLSCFTRFCLRCRNRCLLKTIHLPPCLFCPSKYQRVFLQTISSWWKQRLCHENFKFYFYSIRIDIYELKDILVLFIYHTQCSIRSN